MLKRFTELTLQEEVIGTLAKGVTNNKNSIPLTIKGMTKQVTLDDAKILIAFFSALDDKSKEQFAKEVSSNFEGFNAVLDFAKNYMKVKRK